MHRDREYTELGERDLWGGRKQETIRWLLE